MLSEILTRAVELIGCQTTKNCVCSAELPEELTEESGEEE